MPSTFCIIALIVLPAMVRMVFTVDSEHRLLKETGTRGSHTVQINPFMVRQIRESLDGVEERQTEMQQQPQQFQPPGGAERSWARSINRNRILNSVLAQLQQENSRIATPRLWNDDTDYGDADSTYTDDNADGAVAEYDENSKINWDRGMRHIGQQKYYSICRMEKSTVSFNDPEYEYRPAHYEEIRCISNEYNDKSDKTVCSRAGFECMQWNDTIHITRKKINSGCWESFTHVVPKGCECMWPEQKLGRLEHHQV